MAKSAATLIYDIYFTGALKEPEQSEQPYFTVELALLSSGRLWMGSTEQQLVHAEWKAFAICEKEGPSHTR